MFSWLKDKDLVDKKPLPTVDRCKQRLEKLSDEFGDELISAETIMEKIENLYFLAMMNDGTLWKHFKNELTADMLLDAYIVLKYFSQNHEHYISPLPENAHRSTKLAGKA